MTTDMNCCRFYVSSCCSSCSSDGICCRNPVSCIVISLFLLKDFPSPSSCFYKGVLITNLLFSFYPLYFPTQAQAYNTNKCFSSYAYVQIQGSFHLQNSLKKMWFRTACSSCSQTQGAATLYLARKCEGGAMRLGFTIPLKEWCDCQATDNL